METHTNRANRRSKTEAGYTVHDEHQQRRDSLSEQVLQSKYSQAEGFGAVFGRQLGTVELKRIFLCWQRSTLKQLALSGFARYAAM